MLKKSCETQENKGFRTNIGVSDLTLPNRIVEVYYEIQTSTSYPDSRTRHCITGLHRLHARMGARSLEILLDF